MAQIVISFGSKQLVGVTDAVNVAIGNAEYSVDVTTAETVLELTPTPTNDDLASVTSKLSNRTITSACLHMRLKRPIDFVHLFAPNFCGSSLSVWQGVIEYKDAGFRQLFERLLQVSGLLYLCVGMEEGPELEDRHLQADTFPFGEEPLMISAVRRTEHEGNEWVVRRGPAFAE